jgi:REP element-mobilizing transposase RayT
VTLRLQEGLPSLRDGVAHRVLLKALVAGADRGDFRVLQYSAQSNHVHLLCEANGRNSLSRGIQALKRRIAHALNRLWRHSGAVFADRYHDRVLKSPREVHHALAYLLRNSNHHGIEHSDGLDPCSSARWFHGERPSPFPPAQTWLASEGWLRCGWIDVA